MMCRYCHPLHGLKTLKLSPNSPYRLQTKRMVTKLARNSWSISSRILMVMVPISMQTSLIASTSHCVAHMPQIRMGMKNASTNAYCLHRKFLQPVDPSAIGRLSRRVALLQNHTRTHLQHDTNYIRVSISISISIHISICHQHSMPYHHPHVHTSIKVRLISKYIAQHSNRQMSRQWRCDGFIR